MDCGIDEWVDVGVVEWMDALWVDANGWIGGSLYEWVIGWLNHIIDKRMF